MFRSKSDKELGKQIYLKAVLSHIYASEMLTFFARNAGSKSLGAIKSSTGSYLCKEKGGHIIIPWRISQIHMPFSPYCLPTPMGMFYKVPKITD